MWIAARTASSSNVQRAKPAGVAPGHHIPGRCLNCSFRASASGALRDFVTVELNPALNFLWPALQLSSEDLWEVTENTAWLVNRKMSRGRFLELLRGTLITMNVDHDQARGAGYNRLRRFLPTMGMVCGLQLANQQAVGNWQEVPGAGGPEPVRVARMVNTTLETYHPVPPDWLDLRLGTDDLPDAYRGLPVQDDHLRFSNVAVFVPGEGWRFTTMYGLAYGLESAVVSFNRFPQLGIAIAPHVSYLPKNEWMVG